MTCVHVDGGGGGVEVLLNPNGGGFTVQYISEPMRLLVRGNSQSLKENELNFRYQFRLGPVYAQHLAVLLKDTMWKLPTSKGTVRL